MAKNEGIHEPGADISASAGSGSDALGVYKEGFIYRDAALEFFRSCVGDEIYNRALGCEAGKQHHYVAARAFLNQADWERFVWIEQYGSLADFPG